MYFVLERKGRPGRFFPKGAKLDSDDGTSNLEDAELFKAELEKGVLKTTSELPTNDIWLARAVSLHLK